MRTFRKAVVAATILAGTGLAQARAVDLTGAWATNAHECKNVFVRSGKGKEITFAPTSEVHGGGFIVEPNRLVGRFAKCAIKARKDDGESVNIVAGCATDVMLSSVQFELKVVDANTITRVFPGMEDMEVHYYRCQI
ncbi:hypothetical protein [Bradyrhizobium sp. ARR65]|uniref:hypothetical protein n=1 Tax=Bradyrhizobium sp. ARR65 TaxID=1040989 RepID=UPI000464AD15|nr:hypothetical protein [Bradyrhizobium sp. ARR65]